MVDDWKETIKGLEQFKSDLKPYCGNASDWEKFDNGLLMLKKAEPVEPIYELMPMSTTIHQWVCGKCGFPIFMIVNTEHKMSAKKLAKYCSVCGQAVKWDD